MFANSGVPDHVLPEKSGLRGSEGTLLAFERFLTSVTPPNMTIQIVLFSKRLAAPVTGVALELLAFL